MNNDEQIEERLRKIHEVIEDQYGIALSVDTLGKVINRTLEKKIEAHIEGMIESMNGLELETASRLCVKSTTRKRSFNKK